MGTSVTGRTLSRRALLRTTAGAAGVAVGAGILRSPAWGKPPDDKGGGGNGGGKGGGNGGGSTQSSLFVPPLLVGGAGRLFAHRVTDNTRPGQPSSFLGYDLVTGSSGSMPGPTLVVGQDDTIDVTFHNELGAESTIHWHGMLVRTGMDGQPQEPVAAGAARSYRIPIRQRATMNWYHPHPHGHTAEQVALGLAGAVIIRDAEDTGDGRGLGLPWGGYEVPLVIRDADIDKQGTLIYKPRSSGYLGKLPLVNGTQNAALDVAPGVYRFRLLNGSNGRVMQLVLEGGPSFRLIGVEGGLLPTPWTLSTIDWSMAERLDVLVDFRGLAGQQVLLRDTLSGWTLLTFNVGGDVAVPGGTVSSLPTSLSSTAPAPLVDPAAAYTIDQTFSFDGMNRINGREFDMRRIDAHIRQGVTEVWRFTTGGNGPHPVHIHGDYFQVLRGSGGRRDGVSTDGLAGVFPWELGWKDTVLLQDNETIDVAVNFTKPLEDHVTDGFYLMHCHKLEHEDAGMMVNIDVHGGTPRNVRRLGIA